jgi:hypothetical protein
VNLACCASPAVRIKSNQYRGIFLDEFWLVDEIWAVDDIWPSERLTVNAEVATVLGSIPASSDTVESEVRQIKQS